MRDVIPHDPEALIRLFDATFAEREQTCLVRGDGEPVYLPSALPGELARVVFAHGFFASALHEIAHWCVAGKARRQLPDYGYWYKPDDRSAAEQREFEVVEVKPQSLEWIFSVAAGKTFHFSADNLGGQDRDADSRQAWQLFQINVQRQVEIYIEQGLPERARRFALALAAQYGTDAAWLSLASYPLNPA